MSEPPRFFRLADCRYDVVPGGHQGGGTFGEVWDVVRARDQAPFTLKCSRLDSDSMVEEPVQRRRFEHEGAFMALATKRELPHVVSLHAHGWSEADNSAYILVMARRRGGPGSGEPLFKALARCEDPFRAIACVARQIADTLAVFHDPNDDFKSYLRDLKSDHVLIVTESSGLRVQLIDFGAVRAFDDTDVETARRTTVGDLGPHSPQFRAPEVGHTTGWTSASDLYALGMTLYECLLGRPRAEDELLQSAQAAYGDRRPPLNEDLAELINGLLDDASARLDIAGVNALVDGVLQPSARSTPAPAPSRATVESGYVEPTRDPAPSAPSAVESAPAPSASPRRWPLRGLVAAGAFAAGWWYLQPADLAAVRPKSEQLAPDPGDPAPVDEQTTVAVPPIEAPKVEPVVPAPEEPSVVVAAPPAAPEAEPVPAPELEVEAAPAEVRKPAPEPRTPRRAQPSRVVDSEPAAPDAGAQPELVATARPEAVATVQPPLPASPPDHQSALTRRTLEKRAAMRAKFEARRKAMQEKRLGP